MFESFVDFLQEYDVGWSYVKLSVLLYVVFYVIEEVLGKYSSSKSQPGF